GLAQVQVEIEDAEMVGVTSCAAGHLEELEDVEAGRIRRGSSSDVRADAISADASRAHLRFEVAEGALEDLEESRARLASDVLVLQVLAQEQVLRVVDEAELDVLDAEALQGARQLLTEELRIEAVGEARVFLSVAEQRDRAEGTSLPTSLSDELPIGALGQADLRDEHDLVAGEGAIFHRLGEAVAEETLAVAEGKGRRGVEEVHAAAQGRVHGAPVLGDVEPDAVTAKAHSADAQGLAISEGEGSVGLLTEGGARYEPRGALRRRAPLEASPPELA